MEVGSVIIIISSSSSIITIGIPFGNLYFASVFILLYGQLAETLSNHENIVKLERFLVVTILRSTQCTLFYFERPFDVFLERIEQGRHHFRREVAHSLVS